MRILFLSISSAISNLNNRGIYPDLLRKFANQKHHVYIVAPAERRLKKPTQLTVKDNVSTLLVKTLNITKTNFVEKGISTILIGFLFHRAICKYYSRVKFDLILYATPPISFNNLVKSLKKEHSCTTYLLLKDIFPQNAVDLNALSTLSPIYRLFRNKEKSLYKISDFIGCMSPANIEYVLSHNRYLAPEKIELCPNSINPSNCFITEENRAQIRIKYELPEKTAICVFGGNLGKPQGIDFLIEIMKFYHNRTDVFFVVAGSGRESFRIESFLRLYNPSNVKFVHQLDRINYDYLLQACDIGMIFLNKDFTIPNYPSRLLNYLEFKKPVLFATDLTTDIGRIAMANGYGYWVESGDLESFSYHLDKLLHDPGLRMAMGEKGYNYLISNYTVEHSYNVIMQHFV